MQRAWIQRNKKEKNIILIRGKKEKEKVTLLEKRR